MEKTKINNYLLATFIVLLLLNIFFYFFGNSFLSWFFYGKNKILADQLCPGFNQCPDAQYCDGGGGGGGSSNISINSLDILTFICGVNKTEWNLQSPWKENLNPPSSTAPIPPTTTEPHTCPITNVGEPIVVKVTGSSTANSSLTITLTNKNNPSINTTTNITISQSGQFIVTSTYTFPGYGAGNSYVGIWEAKAQLCDNPNNYNCVTASTTFKMFKYGCVGGVCKFLSLPNAEQQTDNIYCGFWTNNYCRAR